MKKNFIIILTILIILLAISAYYVYNAISLTKLAKNYNKFYEEYYNQEILGTTLISIINKAIDDNEKNGVPTQKNSILYKENNENSIKIDVKFSDDRANVSMESIANKGTEEFVKLYPTATFKCTKIEYHQKTNRIKYMLFEYIKG